MPSVPPRPAAARSDVRPGLPSCNGARAGLGGGGGAARGAAARRRRRAPRLPAARRAARPPPRPALAVADADLHPRRAAARRAAPRPAAGARPYRALVGGLHTTPAVIEHDGAQSGIQLQLSPLGARALLGRAGRRAGRARRPRGGRARPARRRAAGAAARRRLLGRAVPAARRPAGPAAGPGPRRPPPEVRRAWQRAARLAAARRGSPTSPARSAGASATWPRGSAPRSG